MNPDEKKNRFIENRVWTLLKTINLVLIRITSRIDQSRLVCEPYWRQYISHGFGLHQESINRESFVNPIENMIRITYRIDQSRLVCEPYWKQYISYWFGSHQSLTQTLIYVFRHIKSVRCVSEMFNHQFIKTAFLLSHFRVWFTFNIDFNPTIPPSPLLHSFSSC